MHQGLSRLLLIAPFFTAAVVTLKADADNAHETTRDGPWALWMGSKCLVGKVQPPSMEASEGGWCSNFYGVDARGGRVLFRIGSQEGNMVVHWDNVIEMWKAHREDPDHFDEKQLFQQGAQGGSWCLAHDKSICLKIGQPGETATFTTTTTTTTLDMGQVVWVKGQPGQTCYAVCKVGNGRRRKTGNSCIETNWPETREKFTEILGMLGDTTCTEIKEGDWSPFPGQYDESMCFFRPWDPKDKVRCGHEHHAVARYCTCQGKDFGEKTDPPTTTTPMPMTTTTTTPCPKECTSPRCNTGLAVNGGAPLVDGKCTKYCSQIYGDKRYCGVGKDYQGGGHLDCTGAACAPPPPTQPATPPPTSPSSTRRRNVRRRRRTGAPSEGAPSRRRRRRRRRRRKAAKPTPA